MIETSAPASSSATAAPAVASPAVATATTIGDTAPLLSKKPIPPAERLIFALDVPDLGTARQLVATLGDAVSFYKVGLELFMAGSTFDLVDELAAQGKKVFVDLKMYDIPETVHNAVRRLSQRPVTYTTVHGDSAIMEAACRDKGSLGILAVTVLTSLDQRDLRDLGFDADIPSLVLARATRAQAVGCDGVIASAREARILRQRLGDNLVIVTPGIRPNPAPATTGSPTDDQKRVATVESAFRDGADHIVVGRPIRDAADPRQAARDIQARISDLFR
jgi:orotidine-5'-phosphate decarboxylase